MSDHVAGMIADCESKIAQLAEVVEKLRWFQREFPHTAAAIVPIADVETPRRKVTRRKGKKEKVARIAESSAMAEDVITERIIQALTKKSPLPPGELVKAAKADKVKVRRRLQQLEQAGKVKMTGATANRLVHLETVRAPASALGQVEQLDGNVLEQLRGAGRVGRSVRELKVLIGDVADEALDRALTRLKVKQKVRVDDDGRWTQMEAR